MARVPFHYIDLRAFSYETEDEARVEAALRTFLPEEFEVERAESRGHHGDRIVVRSARVERADDVRHVLAQVGAAPEYDRIFDELDDCITFRAKVEAYPAKREAALANARETLEAVRGADDVESD